MYTSIFKGRSQRQQQQRRKRTKFNLFCEQLEGRQLLSTGTTLGSFGPIYLTYGQTLNQVVNDGITPAKVNINGNDVQGTWTFADASNPTKDLTQAVLDAGSHKADLTATFTPAGTTDNYNAASVDVEVAKAKIAIVADSYEKTFGNANPILTDTVYADLGPATGIDPTTGQDYSTETDPGTGKPYEVYEQLGSRLTWPQLPTPTPWVAPPPPAPTPACSPTSATTTSIRHKSVMPVPVPPVTSS